MLSRRSILLAPLAVLALAAPAASAAEVTYDVSAFTFLKGTATGTDNDGWDSRSSYEVEIDQQIEGIRAEDDQEVVTANATGNRMAVTKLKQDYTLDTAAGTLSWGCTENGGAKGAPGSVKLTRSGDVMFAEVTIAQSVAQPRSCTGFSTFADEITIAPGPIKSVFNFPVSELRDGLYDHAVDLAVPCGEWTIYQTACMLKLGGSIMIRRFAAEPEVDPTPTPEPEKPWDGDPEVSSPPRPATPIKPKLLPGAKGAAVQVKCRAVCNGKVSATAVANKNAKAKPIGSKSFTSKGGTQSVKVMFGKGGSRTARQRGAVIIDVKSSGATKSYRLSTR